MKSATTKNPVRMNRLDEGDWLHALLSDIKAEMPPDPSPQAVRRIRNRLLQEMDTPAQVAA